MAGAPKHWKSGVYSGPNQTAVASAAIRAKGFDGKLVGALAIGPGGGNRYGMVYSPIRAAALRESRLLNKRAQKLFAAGDREGQKRLEEQGRAASDRFLGRAPRIKSAA